MLRAALRKLRGHSHAAALAPCEELQRQTARARPWHEARGFPRRRQPCYIRPRPTCRVGRGPEGAPGLAPAPEPPWRAEAAAALAEVEAEAGPPSSSLEQLRSVAQECFEGCLSAPAGGAGPVAVDGDRHRLLVACDDHILVRPLMDRQQGAERLDLGPLLSLKVELGGEQDLEFAVEEAQGQGEAGAAGRRAAPPPWPAEEDALRERHRVSAGWRCGVWMWSPMSSQQGPAPAPEYFPPEDAERLLSALRSLPEGRPVLLAGRAFGDPVDSWNAYTGLEVAGVWESPGVGCTGEFVRFDDPVGYIVKFGSTMSYHRTAYTRAASPQFHRLGETLGHHKFEGAAHGDVFALLAIKGEPSKSKGLIIPASVAKDGLRQAQSRGVATALTAEWRRPLGERITSLAASGPTVLIATEKRILQLCSKSGDLRSLRGPDVGGGTHGKMAVDWQRRVIYLANSGLQAFDFEGTISRQLELPNSDLSDATSVSLHHNWLLVCNTSGVVVIDRWKGVHLDVATCYGAVNASIIQDRLAIVTDHGVVLSAWSVQEIDRHLHRLQEGKVPPPPPPAAVPWLGSAMKGLSTPGFPAASTPLDGVAAALQHHGEVFVAHGAGVFALPLSEPPALIKEEPKLEEDRWAADFRTVYHGGKLALIMSPVVPWERGEVFRVRVALQNSGAFICGLAPEEECFANASVLPAEVCAKQPRVDGILVHATNPWDDRTCARRLYEFMPSDDEGRWEWSKGLDLLTSFLDWRKARKDDDASGRTFFLGDGDGAFILEMQAVARQTDRGGVKYFLQKATLSSPRSESPTIDPIGKPLESFEMGQGRRVRFYVCSLPPASAAQAQAAERKGRGSDDEEASWAAPQAAAVVHREGSLVLAKGSLPSMALVGAEAAEAES